METKQRKKLISFRVKQEAIQDLEQGFETEESLLQKFDIIPKTLRNWKLQVQQPTSGHKSKLIITDADRRKAVREVKSGLLTIGEAVIKYRCRHKTTIREWINRFSDDISDITPLSMPENDKDQEELSAIQKRCKELENALSQAHLKVASLETLIDVAEKELHIDIRKKSGTKQSS